MGRVIFAWMYMMGRMGGLWIDVSEVVHQEFEVGAGVVDGGGVELHQQFDCMIRFVICPFTSAASCIS